MCVDIAKFCVQHLAVISTLRHIAVIQEGLYHSLQDHICKVGSACKVMGVRGAFFLVTRCLRESVSS